MTKHTDKYTPLFIPSILMLKSVHNFFSCFSQTKENKSMKLHGSTIYRIFLQKLQNLNNKMYPKIRIYMFITVHQTIRNYFSYIIVLIRCWYCWSTKFRAFIFFCLEEIKRENLRTGLNTKMDGMDRVKSAFLNSRNLKCMVNKSIHWWNQNQTFNLLGSEKATYKDLTEEYIPAKINWRNIYLSCYTMSL